MTITSASLRGARSSLGEDPPFAHVIRHHEHDRGEHRERNERGPATEEEGDEQQGERVDDAGDRRAARRS